MADMSDSPAIRRGTRVPDDRGPALPMEPRPGYYRARLVKGGPWVPVLMFLACPMDPHYGGPLERSRPVWCRAGVEFLDPDRVWMACRAITRAEYHRALMRFVRLPVEAKSPVDLNIERSLF